MGREAQDDNEGFVDPNLELLRTQVYYLVKLLCLGLQICFYWTFVGTLLIFPLFGVLLQALALSACTTLVSVEPKLTIETRNYVMKVPNFVKWNYMPLTMGILFVSEIFWVMNLWQIWQATLGFFALPNDPGDVVNPLIDNLITLLCAILLTRYSIIKRAMLFLNCLFFWNIIVSLSLEVWVKCITLSVDRICFCCYFCLISEQGVLITCSTLSGWSFLIITVYYVTFCIIMPFELEQDGCFFDVKKSFFFFW